MLEKLNKNYLLKVEVLTPLHIGGGKESNWQKDLDFFCSKGTLQLINREKLFASLSEQDIHRLSAYMAAGKLSEFKNHIIRDKQLLGSITIRNFELKQEPEQDDVVALIRNGNGQIYLPGSSLKGAIRSILFKHLKLRNSDNEKSVFGSISQDWMRLIRITDAPFQKSEIIHTKTFNLQDNRGRYEGGWKHAFRNGTDGSFKTRGFVTTFEVLPSGSSSILRISLADGIFEFIKIKGKDQVNPRTAEFVKSGQVGQLFHIINQHTTAYLKKEIKFYEKFTADRSDLIHKQLKALQEMIPADERSCVLRIGLGSGFHSITGDWQHDDFTKTGIWEKGRDRGKFKVKSRKLAFSNENGSLNLMPLGFIKLTILTDEEYHQELVKEATKEQEANRQEQIRLKEAAQAAEEENQRQEAEAEAARKAREEAEAVKKRVREEKLAGMPKSVEGELKNGDIIEAEIYKIEPAYNMALYCPAPGEYSQQTELVAGKKVMKATPDFDQKFTIGTLVKARVEISNKKDKVTLYFLEFIDR